MVGVYKQAWGEIAGYESDHWPLIDDPGNCPLPAQQVSANVQFYFSVNSDFMPSHIPI